MTNEIKFHMQASDYFYENIYLDLFLFEREREWRATSVAACSVLFGGGSTMFGGACFDEVGVGR